MQVRLFGRFAVTTGDGKPVKIAGKKHQALFAYLVVNAGQAQPRERLAGLLWGDRFDDQAHQSLRQAISKLRKDLGDAEEKLLLTDADTITLNADAITIDALEFEKLAVTDSSEALEEAATLYGGAFLDGFNIKEKGFEDWISAQRSRYEDRAADVLSKHCLQQEAAGQIIEAIATAKKLVWLDPLREHAHRRLMRLFASNGQRPQALKQYRLCSGILQKELGVEPDAETKQLYEDVRGGEALLPATPRDAGQPDSDSQAVLPVSDKPSIAVLPFDNMSSEPEHEHFADGIAEDIITGLSKISRMRVIARNSTFAYKGEAHDVRQVASDLGVRYILEGSIRSGGNRLRISAQLIDADDGSHIWGERFDRTIDDIFDIQDEITKEIVTALRVNLTDGEEARVLARGTNDIEAWQLCVRATELYLRFNSSDFLEARALAEKAIQRDPNYAYAWATLGLTFWFDGRLGYTVNSEAKFARANECAKRAMALDDTISPAITLSVHVAGITGHVQEGVAIARRGFELYPGNADVRGMLGFALIRAGNYRRAVGHFRAAMSLNPFYPNWYRNGLTRALMILDEFDQALVLADETLRTEPANIISWVHKAYIFGQIGRSGDAEEAIRELTQIAPNLRLKHVPGMLMINDATATQCIVDGLRKVGFPE